MFLVLLNSPFSHFRMLIWLISFDEFNFPLSSLTNKILHFQVLILVVFCLTWTVIWDRNSRKIQQFYWIRVHFYIFRSVRLPQLRKIVQVERHLSSALATRMWGWSPIYLRLLSKKISSQASFKRTSYK